MYNDTLEGFRLSPQQRRLWSLQRLAQNQPYLTQCRLLLEGLLDLHTFEKALQDVVSRHEILRTSFRCLPGIITPLQFIADENTLSVRKYDLSSLETQEQEAGSEALTLEARFHSWDFESTPLFSVSLITLTPYRHLLLITASALCADGTTLKNLIEEVSHCYAASVNNETYPNDPMQYADLSEWQNELLQEEAAQAERAYWHKLDRSQMTAMHLPFRELGESSQPLQQEGRFAPQTRTIPLEDELSQKIIELAQQCNCSSDALLLTCWQIVLARFTGVPDLIIGVTGEGRHYQQLATALGPYTRVIPLKSTSTEGCTFKEAIINMESSQAKALARQEYFVWDESDEQTQPFIPLGFEFADWSTLNPDGETHFVIQQAYSCLDRFVLKLAILRTKWQLSLTLHYDPTYLSAKQISYLGNCLTALIRDAITRPQVMVDMLELLDACEQQRLLQTYTQTAANYSYQPLHQLFEAQAEQHGNEMAVICGREQLTYQQLNMRSNQLAHCLIQKGITSNSLVALCLPRSTDLLIALLAVLKAGGAYIPLDPDVPAARLHWLLQNIAPCILLTHQACLPQLTDWNGPTLCLDQAPYNMSEWPQHNPQIAVSPEDLAYIIYTSGSTGEPKGVMIQHRAVSNYTWALSERMEVKTGWHFATVSTLAADLGNTAIFCSLASGGCLHILPYEILASPHALQRYIQDYPLDVLKIVPSHFSALLGQEQEQHILPRRFLVLGGEVLSNNLLSRLAQIENHCHIINHYGPTETTVGALTHILGEATTAVRVTNTRTVPIGKPISNLQAYILDKNLALVPVGVVGELYLAGMGLALGYLQKAEQTAERFVPHGFSQDQGQRMYRTGDLARYREDGLIEFVGRHDEQVKLRGYRIELKEIEVALERHPAIEEAVVLVHEKTPEDKQLQAYVVLHPHIASSSNGQPHYRLANGMSIAYHNKSEVDYQYQEIFEKQAYLQHGLRLPENACVFDVGANIGLFTLFVGWHCPDARIYAFEPLKPIFETLHTNAKKYLPQAKLFQIGLSNSEKMETFTFYPHYTMMSGLKAYANAEEEQELVKQILHNEQQHDATEAELLAEQADTLLAHLFAGETQTAKLRRLSSVIHEEGIERIDLLKVDAQRAELDVFKGIQEEDWDKIQQIVVEVHDGGDLEHGGQVQDMLKLLEEHGYTTIVEQDPAFHGTDRYNLYAIRRDYVVHEDINREKAQKIYKVDVETKSLSTAEIRQFLQELLPEYMLPAEIFCLERLPLTGNGKVDRKSLLALVPLRQERAENAEEARTPVEEVMVGIWQELLSLVQVGRRDNFFHQGGHSLLGMKLISRLRVVFGVEIPITWVFETPIVSELSARVEDLLRGQNQQSMPPLHPMSRQEEIPLSFAQQRLWFLDELDPNNTAYIMPSAVRLLATTNRPALERALNDIIKRHESLRTTFVARNGQPIQIIAPALSIPLRIVDLSFLSPEEHKGEAQLLVQQEAEQPFNLAHGPLLRAYLLQLAEQDQVLLLSMHHIISDGWSNGILVRELTTLYAALCEGKEVQLPDLAVQYADYALWQRQWLVGTILQQHLDYWCSQLADIAPLALLTDHRRPPVQTYQGEQQSIVLPATLLEQLRTLSQQEGVTLFMTLLAAFQVLLLRYSGQEDFAVGTPIANRTSEEVEGLIGFFVNTLVLRANLSGNPSFVQLLERVREMALQAYLHQDVPFEQVVEAVQPQRDHSRSPLFQVFFALQNTPDIPVEQLPIQSENFSVASRTTKFELSMIITETRQGLNVAVQYNTDLFEPPTITRLLEHWQVLLEAITQNATQPIESLPLLTIEERERVLIEWNTTRTNSISRQSLQNLFEDQVERTPHAIALVWNEEQLTYAELNRRANQLAHHLGKQGIGLETQVGVCMERSLEMVIGLLSILKAGGAYVPLDPGNPQVQLAYRLQDAQLSVVLTQHSLLERLPIIDGIRFLCLDSAWQDRENELVTPPMYTKHPDQSAYVIYTSGSTGAPKGVVITHRSAIALIDWARQYYSSDELAGVLASTSICFDLSIFELFVPLSTGGTVVLVENLLQLPELLAARRVTLINTVPSVLTEVLALRALPASVRTVNLAGEALPLTLVHRLYQHKTIQTINNLYGPTEDTTYSTVARLSQNTQEISIGRPIANTQMYVLDTQQQPVPIGVAGELSIGGTGLARGYWQRPDLTAERFVPHPFSRNAGERLYRTGDRVRYRPDGTLEFLGRLDQQVKLRGYRIEPGEIEATLAQHPNVRQSVVLPHEDALNNRYLIAYVVVRQKLPSAKMDLRDFLKARLPEHLRPSQIVLLDALPLTPNGKVDRHRLSDLVPNLDQVEHATNQRHERSPLHTLVAQCWQEVLQRTSIGEHEHFFEIGGHSLLATQIIARLRRQLKREVPLRLLFEAPTIASLTARLEELQRQEQGLIRPALLPASQVAELPLSFAQKRLWFLYQLNPQNTAYNLSGAVRLQGDLQVSALQHSFFALVQRHASLRTHFEEDTEGQVEQCIGQMIEVPFPVIDMSTLEPGSREIELQKLLYEDAHQPFDLSRGPVCRARLLKQEEMHYVLVLSMHHIVSDGWSMNILVQELITLYQAFVAGDPSPLKPLPISYTDHALWQREWLQGEVLREQIRYWTRQLSGAKALELPGDHARPQVFSGRGARYSFTLDSKLVQDLARLCRQEEVTLFMALLATFQILLYRLSGEQDIVVGIDSANRSQLETEGLIGFFVNVLALRLNLEGNPTFRHVLGKVRELVLEANMHLDLPFETVIEHLRLERKGNRTPLVNVLFVMQNTPGISAELPDMVVSPIERESTTAKFDLALFLTEDAQQVHGTINYSTDLFEEATIARIMDHYNILLHDIATRPEFPIDSLETSTEEDRQLHSLQKKRHLNQQLSKMKNVKGDMFDLS